MDDEAAMNKEVDSKSEHRMENYKIPDNLNTRISIHDKYSGNRQGFSAWLFQNMQLNYLYSLPSASSLSPKDRPTMKIALGKHMTNGILRIS